MIKGLKICGISDPKTLNYILNHPHPPKFIGFITNYKKSKRYVAYENLKNLINVTKKQTNFVSVLVNPSDELLEKIKDLNFDYYQLYDVDPVRTAEFKNKYKIKIISAITISNRTVKCSTTRPWAKYTSSALPQDCSCAIYGQTNTFR